MSDLQVWWKLTQQAIEGCDWPTAEGALRRLLALSPGKPELLDLLSYALLMQGQFSACEAALREALEQGSCSFWTPHKLGDALRGQQRMEEAVTAYEQALRWGSDSPLTSRNLLQVLDGMDPAQALERLNRFADGGQLHWAAPPPWVQGACEAALLSSGLELAQWLHSRGCTHPGIRQLALEDAVVRFDLVSGLELAEGPLLERLKILLNIQ